MIGQNILIDRIKGQIEHNKFPRFSIFIGESGSGKKTLCRDVATWLNCGVTFVSIKVDDIRAMIDTAYRVDLPILYVIADCDNMSSSAANALLKITEEPPNNAYFILTCEDIDNLLPTIKSRGVTYMLEPYTYEEKCDFLESANNFPKLSDKEVEFILNVASNMGEIKLSCSMDFTSFVSYVNLVVDNIAEVSGSNAFKIADQIAFKDEDNKFNLKLFWKAFISVCVDRMVHSDDPLKYSHAVAITGDNIQQLSIRGINKQMLFDTWLLDIREAWYDDN